MLHGRPLARTKNRLLRHGCVRVKSEKGRRQDETHRDMAPGHVAVDEIGAHD